MGYVFLLLLAAAAQLVSHGKCAFENPLTQTVEAGQQTLRQLELFLDYVRWLTPN